jgi:hypothetical protein
MHIIISFACKDKVFSANICIKAKFSASFDGKMMQKQME